MSLEQQMYHLCSEKNVACLILQRLQPDTDNNYAQTLMLQGYQGATNKHQKKALVKLSWTNKKTN